MESVLDDKLPTFGSRCLRPADRIAFLTSTVIGPYPRRWQANTARMKSLLLPPVFGRGLGLLMACELGCASTQSTEISALRQEIAALRSSHDSDRKRIERLESEVDAQEIEMGKATGSTWMDNEGDLPPRGVVYLPIVRPSSPRPSPSRPEPGLPTFGDERSAQGNPPPKTSLSCRPTRSTSRALPTKPTLFASKGLREVEGRRSGRSGHADFRGFVHHFPNHPSADNALLDEGLAFIGLRRCEDADRTFTEIERRYPAGDALPEALWRKAGSARR